MTTEAITGRFPTGLPVGDGWVPAPATEPVTFPYDGSEVARAPVGDEALARRAVEHAAALRKDVARLPTRVRRRVLGGVAAALAEVARPMEDLLVLETGKPRVDCRTEVQRAVATWEAAADEVAHIHGETVPLDLLPSGDGMTGFWTRRPIGVVVGIAGFNYPMLLASHKIAPALAAGCPVVVKPAPATPLATLWLVHLVRGQLAAAGAPTAAVQLVTGDAAVGRTLTTHDAVAAVSFTGSAAIGHRIARDAAPRKVVLELGSNAALVVAADADLDAAADAVLRGGYYASGQACIAVQRVIAVEEIAEELEKRITDRLAEVVVGDPREEATRVSALIDEAATDRVLAWVDEARAAGARVVAGGVRDGRCIAPALLADVPEVPSGLSAWDEEIFGPVVALRAVPDLDAAYALVNDSRYGLHAAVFTRDLGAAFTAIDALDVGGVVINEVPGYRSDVAPYGGVKDSGIGREGPRFAIEELTVTRMAVIRT
ncbi:aldehyde dehydrogenase family protein [Streptomyces purpurogeneiscleroticus]|uniref:aldehyde dehydrogenase family protein n=1 Tax=Streptomyces purpurogeneiscleroticus TaxID=68259 RepID=UPI001CBD70BA|nr:aldehyde dehydrogenase family protein [Streptomyces purpurogeneiscleroticus]MBZ4014890.1 aldehyde dehydrogenase [Streptomyces purpurogeneiscleroticus]